ncbi:putative ATP-dependent DNA helicase [Trypoxylus dichotomus]
MISGEQPVESYLHKSLAEHVNAEVVLRTITDLSVAMHWLSSTFLYIRARKNPKNYSLSSGLSQAQLDKKLLEICQIEINKLAKAGMLTIDQNVSILPTRVGSLMAKYCVALDTMKLFIQVTGKEVLQQILSLISKCREFSDIRLRTNDKRPLNILNQNRNKRTIRFPLSGRIKTLDMKINCIIQAILGSLEISEPSLLVEGQRIMRVGGRLLNCLSEYFEGKEDYYQALLSSLTLAKCFHARIWENSPYVSRQLEGIGVTLSNALVEAGKTTFKEILNSNPRDLERIINKRPPFGNRIQDQVKMLPQYDLSLKEVVLDDGKITIEIGITLENSAVFESDITVNPDSVMSLLVGDSENKVLLHERYTHMYMIENVRVVRSVDIQTSFAHEVFVHFISDDWVGIDVQRSIKQFVHEEVPSESKTAIPLNTAIVAQEFSDSTKGSIKPQITKIKKTERNTKTKMLQQFMDQYFKKVKSPKRERKTLQKKRSSNVLKRKTSINVAVEPETGSETIILSNELPNKESPVNEAVSDEVVETLNSHETTLTEDKGVTLIHKDEIVTNVVNSSIDLYKQKSACNKGEIPQESGIENDVLPPTPMFRNLKSEQGHLFKSSVRRLTTQRKREFENMRTMELESSIYREDTPKFDFSQYAKEPKKKVGEPTTLESESKNLCPTKAQDNRNTTKLLSWSSPLVISPKLRHSPHLSNNLSENEKNVEKVDAPKQVLSLKNNAKVFSVADKDCSSTGLTDVWSQSFLDYLGITSTKTEDSVRRDTTTSINTADILAQNSLKAIKCDLNQTVSSASSESTNISSAPKINSTTWYTQILKKSLEVKSKCVGSQTEEFMLNTVNDSAVATDRENRQAEINDLHTLKVVSSDKIPEKIEKPTIEYTKANIEPKNIQTQQKSQNVETLFSRNNSWQEEFLSNEPFFDTVTTRQEYLNDNNVKNQIDRRNQRNVNEFDDFNGWSNDIHKDDKVLPQKDLSSSHLDLLDNTQSNVVNNNKYSLLDNSFKRPAFDQRHDFFLKTSRNVYIQPKSDHQIKKRCDEEYWNWLDKEEVTNINDGVSNPSTADYLRSTPNVFDIKISERANENRLHQTCVHCPPNVSFPRPTFKDSWQPKVKHEHLNSYQRQDNNLQRIRPDFNINRPSNYHRKYDFDNNYKHQLYDQQKVIPQVLPNDPCNNEYFFRRNKCLTSRGVSNLPFPTEKQEDFRRPNMPQQYFENSTLLPRPSASPLSENRNQNIGLNTSYIFNETNNKNYQTYPENNFETGYLNTTFIPTCSSKPSELADVEGHTTNKVKRCHSFDRELLPTFMAERDSQVIAYQKNNYPNFTYYAPPRSSEFYENHTELPFKENLNINHENIHHRSFHSSAVDVDNQTKNNFLLSHYFQSRPKPETFHFNRELLNLDHTITSEYIQDIDNNF